MTDHNLREIASRCEAKLHGVRRTAEGAVISFVIHPAELPPVLMLDPLGTRYMLAFVAIADDETPIPGRNSPDGPTAALLDSADKLRELTSASHRDDGERPLSVTRPVQQGVIHSWHPDPDSSVLDDGKFGGQQPGCGTAGLTAKARYAAMTAGEQAVQRAGMLPQDERFRAWVNHELYGLAMVGAASNEEAAGYIRARCCNGLSRKLIAEDPEAMDKFIALETAFKIAVGEIAEPR